MLRQPHFLLDTHALVRLVLDSGKLSKEQLRTAQAAVRRTEPLAFSAISLMEMALLVDEGKLRLRGGLDLFFNELRSDPAFQMLPLTYEIASDVRMLANLRDPADRVIAATARVHRLSLITSDQRIIESGLVAVVE